MSAATLVSSPPASVRDRLLDAATLLFATRGYQAIGLRDLAGHLGLHAGSLYHHIENKQCLLFELIESALADLLCDTRRRMRGAKTADDRVRRFVQAFVSFSLTEQHRLQLVIRELVNLSEEQQQQINTLKSHHAAILNSIIATECAPEVRQESQIGLMTHAVIGMLYGHAQWHAHEVSEQRLAQALTGFVMGIIESAKGNTHRA